MIDFSLNNKIVWDNQDTVPHTATSGTGPTEPENAKAFDTSIINPGENSDARQLFGVSEGQIIPYIAWFTPMKKDRLQLQQQQNKELLDRAAILLR